MPEPTRVLRFDDAFARLGAFLREHPTLLAAKPVLVRDLYGRIRVALNDRDLGPTEMPDPQERESLARELHFRLGAWSPGVSSIFLLASQMFAPEEVFATSDALWCDPVQPQYRILDRNVIGSDWLREPFEEAPPPRVTFFGIKGGVGRSTAAVVLAWRFCRAGRRVLVLDLDLESPGIGTTLLPADAVPDYGIVDWFVEQAVGQANEDLLDRMAAPSPLSEGGTELLVVPASGRPREGYTYLPKLARAYAELSSNGEGSVFFAERLNGLVCRLEELYQPDVTFLDSRAGLHDIAAASLIRMNATSLLFAVDTLQTWQAYRALFQVWHTHFDRAQAFRENLKMVAAQIPETDTLPYLESFEQQAYDLFADHLYVEASPGETSEFNFDLKDSEAPHSPLRIHWSRTFQQFNPAGRPGAVTDEQLRAAFGDFVAGVSLLVLGEDVP